MNGHQNSSKVVFSLKYKILLLLMVLCILGLGIFLWISLSHFVADKRNYLLESSTQLTSAETEILNKEVGNILEYLQILGEGYNAQTLSFSDQAREFFTRQKSILKTQIVEYQGSERKVGFLLNKTGDELQLDSLPFFKVTETAKPTFICDVMDPARVVIVTRLSAKSYQYLVAEVRILLISSLMERKNFQFAMVCPDNPSVFLPLSKNTPRLQWEKEQQEILSSKSFTKEVRVAGKEYLMSGSVISGTALHLISFIDSDKAMQVIKRLQTQAVMVFLTILGLISIAALLAATRMTAALEDLTAATKRIAVGDFNISLKIKSSDEVAVLANSFLWMKDKIIELLEKAKEATRMEAEIETATLVQKTLFPVPEHSTEYFELSGEFKTASECGGDLWHYFETERYLYVFIGDVVGHGVPSALMTTAARSVTAIVRMQNISSPAETLRLLNHAIYETSKGKMWMTFFAGKYDKSTGILTYSSASHNPPFLFPNKEDLKKSDIPTLMESIGPSLGRQEYSEYSESQIEIGMGDLVFFYTDGLTECVNAKKEQLGESKLIRGLLKSWNTNKSADSFTIEAIKIMEKFRDNHPLEDDVTFFALRRLK